jgi:uncharacterized protein (DUF488 family)
MKEVWTIGHSTRSIEQFISLLESFDIRMVVDVRHFPGSRRYPHFNKDILQQSLSAHKIGYKHLPDLGGRRKPLPDSINTAWRHSAFRGYADHMQTQEFSHALKELESISMHQPTAYMCSEAVWWSCHRSLISDVLKLKGWMVWHIMDTAKATEHPYTKPARIVDGKLLYS